MTEFLRSGDGFNIAYDVVGSGTPVVLIHGFASSRAQNWKAVGWYETLTDAGYRVVALDCRGHGESDKPHDVASYGHDKMGGDVLAVLDAAGCRDAHIMGYSMGGMLTVHLLMRYPERIRRVVIGGVGESYLAESSDGGHADPALRKRIVEALLAEDKSTIADPVARGFRAFADQDGKDRRALAACMGADRHYFTRAELARSMRPALVVCGENDERTGAPDGLARALANGQAVTVLRRDHMTTVGDRVYKDAVLKFLAS